MFHRSNQRASGAATLRSGMDGEPIKVVRAGRRRRRAEARVAEQGVCVVVRAEEFVIGSVGCRSFDSLRSLRMTIALTFDSRSVSRWQLHFLRVLCSSASLCGFCCPVLNDEAGASLCG